MSGGSGLVDACIVGVLAGLSTVSISTSGRLPKGFPRSELLSVGTNGSHNYAVCPLKVLTWIHKQAAALAAAQKET